ncbi:MAG: MarR family winged helix-turn-helix transcriptional regulator [Chloroflexota bacterium]
MTNSDPLLSEMQEWVEVSMRHSMHGLIRHSKEKGFSMTQVSALFHLRHRGSCGVSDLAEHLGVTNAAASQMLDRLVEQSLIVRSEDPHDRRGKQIVLSDQGLNLLKESVRARQGWVADLILLLTPDQKAQVLPAIKILIEKTKQLGFIHGQGCPHHKSDI